MQYLSIVNNKILPKEIKDLNKQKDVPCSWNGKLNIIKVKKSSQCTQKSGRSPQCTYKILANFLSFLKKHIDKLNEYTGRQRTFNTQTILKEKNKCTQVNFKTYYLATVIKTTVWHCFKMYSYNFWKRTESRNILTHMRSINFWKRCKVIH